MGISSRILDKGMTVLYATVPSQLGLANSKSFETFGSTNVAALYSNMERLTEDFIPSAPTRISHSLESPSSNMSLVGPFGVGGVIYD